MALPLKTKMALYFEQRCRCEGITLVAADLPSLRFFQFREGNTAALVRRAGHCDVRLEETPHQAFATELAAGTIGIGTGQAAYRDYLEESWRKRSIKERRAQIQSFCDYFRGFSENRIKPNPVILTRINPDGPFYVVDGNHRVVFAQVLNRSLRAEIWPFDLVLRKYGPSASFFELDKYGQPYQTISYRGTMLAPGRRGNIVDIINMIPKEVIQGQRILDVGANIGMISKAAKYAGAASVTGVEISQVLVDWANRFSVFDGLWPDVQIIQGDAANPGLLEGQIFDTVFMMSIFSHIPDKTALSRIAYEKTLKHIVFECHSGKSWNDYASYFDVDLFKSKKLLGVLNVHPSKSVSRREIWLLSR